MDPGERITGTPDERYNLVSVLYHVLHGAENCNTYALDAEAAGNELLAAFFREAGVMQARLAERAKGMLGILEVPPEPEIRPEGAVPSGPAPADVQTGGSPPTAEIPRRTPDATLSADEGAGPPSADASRHPDLVFPDEDVVVGEEALAETTQAPTDRITPEDFDPTILALEGGAAGIPIGQALAEIETWERKLEATGNPKLQSIAGNLGALRGLLSADDIDIAATGPLLTTLGEQIQGVATSGAGALVADKLQRLSELLISGGRSLSG